MVGDSALEREHMGSGGEACEGRSEMEQGAKLLMALQAAVRSFLSSVYSRKPLYGF